MQNVTIEERVALLELQVVDLDEDVDFLFDEQVIQDERLLGLENRVLDVENRMLDVDNGIESNDSFLMLWILCTSITQLQQCTKFNFQQTFPEILPTEITHIYISQQQVNSILVSSWRQLCNKFKFKVLFLTDSADIYHSMVKEIAMSKNTFRWIHWTQWIVTKSKSGMLTSGNTLLDTVTFSMIVTQSTYFYYLWVYGCHHSPHWIDTYPKIVIEIEFSEFSESNLGNTQIK